MIAPSPPAARWCHTLVAAAFVLIVGVAAPVRAQVAGVRFEITAVGDTTLEFPVGQAKWVKKGTVGLAIDPMHHDVLIAQFLVARVRNGTAMGVIIGQTAPVTRDHVVLLQEPRHPFFRKLYFWGGMLVGFALGVISAHW